MIQDVSEHVRRCFERTCTTVLAAKIYECRVSFETPYVLHRRDAPSLALCSYPCGCSLAETAFDATPKRFAMCVWGFLFRSLVKVNLFLLKVYGGAEVKFHSFVNSGLDGGEWSNSRRQY